LAHAHPEHTGGRGLWASLEKDRGLTRQKDQKSGLGMAVIFCHIKHSLLKGLFHAFKVKTLANDGSMLTDSIHEGPGGGSHLSAGWLPLHRMRLAVTRAQRPFGESLGGGCCGSIHSYRVIVPGP